MKSTTVEGRAKTKNGVTRLVFSVICILLEVIFIILMFTKLNRYAEAVNLLTRVVGVIVILNMYASPVTSTIKVPWILLILMFPIMGLGLYLLVGLNGGTEKMRRRYQKIDEQLLPLLPENRKIQEKLQQKIPKAGNISSYIHRNAAYPVYQNTDVTYFDEAAKGLEAQLQDLAKAEQFIFMEYHAIEDAEAWHRIQQVLDAAAAFGRKVAVTGRSMENIMKVSTELGYMKVPKNTLVDINRIKGLPKNKQVIVTTGSQGEEMSALYRMAFSQHKQVEIGAGDKVIISASAIPGNEVTVSRVINELFRKGVKVVYDRADMLHVSGHACQEELKIIHALTKPRFFIPLHGEQRMLQIHSQLAQDMGMDRNHIAIADNGSVIEITAKTIKLGGTVPSGEVYVDGSGVGDVGAVVMRDRKRLAEDGMVVVVLPISAHDGNLLSEPEIITRGFIYVKESGDLMKELQSVARDAAENVSRKRGRDDGELKGSVKSAVSSYLFKTTKRNPMVIPVVTRL